MMTSFYHISSSRLIALAFAIVLVSNCPEAGCSINQSYNATGPKLSPDPSLRPYPAGVPVNVTEQRLLSSVDPPTVGIKESLMGTKVWREDDEVIKKAPAHVRRKRSGQEEPSDATPVVLKCGVSCTCNVLNKTLYEEYRVICNNTRQEAVILSSGVFQSDGRPTWNKQVYVRVQGVTSVVVTAGFVARWTAYNSCAMDFWDSGDIVLPPGPIEKAETGAFSHAFAGLGIKNSRLAQIPHGVFADIEKYGLDLENVSLPILNLYNLVYPPSNSLRYLRLTNVVVGALEGKMANGMEDDSANDEDGGSNCCSIILEAGSSSQKKLPGIWINNSRIGVIEQNGLNLISDSEIAVSLENSEIGMIKKYGLQLKGKIVFQILNTRVSLEGQGSIVLDEEMTLKAIHNRIILPQNIFNKWDCEQNNIEGNDFIVVKIPASSEEENIGKQKSIVERFQEASMIKTLKNGKGSTPQPIYVNGTTTTERSIPASVDDQKRPVKELSELDAFIHPTCVDHNRILNAPLEAHKKVQENPQTEPPLEISPSESDSISNHSLETETVFPIISPDENQPFSIASNSTSEKHLQVHKGLAYMILAAVGALLLIVLVLVGILVFRKKRESRDIYQEAASRDRRPSLMYMPGSSVYGNDSWPIPPAHTS